MISPSATGRLRCRGKSKLGEYDFTLLPMARRFRDPSVLSRDGDAL